MIPITLRLWIALGMLVLSAGAAIALTVTGNGDGDAVPVLIGWASATFLQLLDMLQARKRATTPPPAPPEPLPREDTHPRLPIALPTDEPPMSGR